MSLPVINAPEHSVKLFSKKEPVTIRPYLVKEEKILLMAKESGSEADIETAVKQIIRNCTFGKLDIESLPSFDLEFLFLQLRARSVNNIIEIHYQCRAQNADGEECKQPNAVRIPLDDITIVADPEHKNLVQLASNLTVEMKYPTTQRLQSLVDIKKTDVELSVDVIADCIKTLIIENKVYEATDYTKEDLVTFIDGLTLPQVGEIQKFFDTMPGISYNTTFKCVKCGYTEPLRYKGLMDFFD